MTWSAGAVLTAAQLDAYAPQAWVTGWTPSVTAETGTFTTVSGAGRYIHVGKTCHWALTITITTVGTAANGLRFGLPGNAQASGVYIGNGRSPGGLQVQVIANTASQAQANEYDNTSAIAVGTVIMSGTYELA